MTGWPGDRHVKFGGDRDKWIRNSVTKEWYRCRTDGRDHAPTVIVDPFDGRLADALLAAADSQRMVELAVQVDHDARFRLGALFINHPELLEGTP